MNPIVYVSLNNSNGCNCENEDWGGWARGHEFINPRMDQNVLIVDDLTLDDINLDKFYVDEDTVYVKAIAIYEWLQEQGVKADTTAFGYRLKLK